MPDLDKVLQGLGFSGATIERIRLSRGVVGKTAYVAIVALFALAVVATRIADSNPWFLLAIGGFIALIFAAFLAGTLWFAHRNPGVAMLEGAELIQWQQIHLAVKGGVPPPTPILPGPGNFNALRPAAEDQDKEEEEGVRPLDAAGGRDHVTIRHPAATSGRRAGGARGRQYALTT